MGYAESGLKRGAVLARFDSGDGLARDADTFREIGLRHLAMLETEATDLVGDVKDWRLRHAHAPRRYMTICAMATEAAAASIEETPKFTVRMMISTCWSLRRGMCVVTSVMAVPIIRT